MQTVFDLENLNPFATDHSWTIEAKLELPLNGGHVFATVAHKEVVHRHATGHTSGDGVCNAVDLKTKKGDRENAALGHPQLLVVWVGKDSADPNPKVSV